MKAMHYLTMAVLLSGAAAMASPVYAEGGNKNGTYMNNRTSSNTNMNNNDNYRNRDMRTQGSSNQNRGTTVNGDQPNTYDRMDSYETRNNNTTSRNSSYGRQNNNGTTGGTNQRTQ